MYFELVMNAVLEVNPQDRLEAPDRDGAAEAADVDARGALAERRRRLESRDLRVEEGRADRRLGGTVNPVVARDVDEVGADVRAVEAEVVVDDVAGAVDEAADVARDGVVEADVTARHAADVRGEARDRGDELAPDDSLNLNLADLLGDDALGELGEDRELLLDDRDINGLADDFRLGRDDGLGVERAIEVALAVEVVEVVQAVEATPVVEGDVAQARGHADVEAGRATGNVDRAGGDGHSEGGSRDQSLGEHFRNDWVDIRQVYESGRSRLAW